VFLPNTTGIIESMSWSWHETRNTFKIAVEKSTGENRSLLRPRRIWEDWLIQDEILFTDWK
jgi:hypothetical protein